LRAGTTASESTNQESEGEAMNKRQKHEAEMRYRLRAYLDAVEATAEATNRRNQAEEAYDKALATLLEDVQA